MTSAPPSIAVLVVDDDYHVAQVHAAFVSKVAGFSVVGVAHSAAAAVEEAASLRPDLVLMDIYLPDGSGLDVVRTLLSTDAPPAVMVISASRDVSSVRAALQLGAVHYLVKPFRFPALAERLEAFREAQRHLTNLPDEASQDDVNRVFTAARPTPPEKSMDQARFAPTLRRVYDAVQASPGITAAEVGGAVGISRATAQRYLTRLEQRGLVAFALRYGSAGRPEHEYSVTRR